MKLLSDKDHGIINSIVSEKEHSSFLQSFEWGKFQQALGKEILRVLWNKNYALLIKQELPFGQYYWHCPRGPILETEGGMREFIDFVRAKGGIFLRVEPMQNIGATAGADIGAKKVKHVQPENTWLLDLSQELEGILKNAHQKTRYNIRLAKKKGVAVKYYERPAQREINEFTELMKQTSRRQKFGMHHESYYKTMLNVLCEPKSDGAKAILFTAYLGKKPVASNITVHFGDTATYLHGASLGEHKNIMAPHLLQWSAISMAKTRGYRYYDFWGVSPYGVSNHKWEGITRFKKGFGGFPKDFPGTFEIPISRLKQPLYQFAKLCLNKK